MAGVGRARTVARIRARLAGLQFEGMTQKWLSAGVKMENYGKNKYKINFQGVNMLQIGVIWDKMEGNSKC